VGPLTPEETQVLLQKLSINNPFYRFRKQSNSLKELRRNGKATSASVRSRSETDLGQVSGQQLLPPHQQMQMQQQQHSDHK